MPSVTFVHTLETPSRSADVPGRALAGLVAAVAGLVVAFVVVPPRLAASGPAADLADHGRFLTAVRVAVVEYWQSGVRDHPPALQRVLDYWVRFHLVKGGIAALLLIAFGALSVVLWRTFLRAEGLGRGSRAALVSAGTVVPMLALFALAVVMANIQGAVSPFASLLPILMDDISDPGLAGTLAGARQQLAGSHRTNGYTPPALSSLRRRVIPIGSYQIATAPLSPELAQRLVPRGRVFSDTKHLLYYFRLSPDHRMVFGGRASFTPTGIARIAAILRAGMQEVFPQLSTVGIEFAWSGKVAYPLDHLPHVGTLDGVHYSLGYCGHGVALATYLGHRMAEVIAGDGQVPDLGSARFRALPFFNGFPWFLPLVGGYYRARDWVS